LRFIRLVSIVAELVKDYNRDRFKKHKEKISTIIQTDFKHGS